MVCGVHKKIRSKMQKDPDETMTESMYSESVHKFGDKETEVLARTKISNHRKNRIRGLLQLSEGNGRTVAKRRQLF